MCVWKCNVYICVNHIYEYIEIHILGERGRAKRSTTLPRAYGSLWGCGLLISFTSRSFEMDKETERQVSTSQLLLEKNTDEIRDRHCLHKHSKGSSR